MASRTRQDSPRIKNVTGPPAVAEIPLVPLARSGIIKTVTGPPAVTLFFAIANP